MTIVRAFLLGLLAAAALLVTLGYGPHPLRLPGAALVLLAYAGVAVFGPGTRGAGARLLRGALGSLVAGAGAIAVFLASKGRNHWFDWPADSGAECFLLVLATFAAVPGGAAAAAGRLRGLALASGFSLVLTTALLLSGPRGVGLAVLLAVGTVLGALVGALAPRSVRAP